jgi:acetylglutamate kinase
MNPGIARRRKMRSLMVVKFGGSLLKNLKAQDKFLKELAQISQKRKVILVHGGGPEINALLEKFSITSKFVKGLRFTDAKSLSIIEMALNGKVNGILTSGLIKNGANAVGISAKDGKSVICKQIKQLGLVGEPIEANKKLIKNLLNAGFLPVIASIASNALGDVMNVNADTLAAYIATAFKAKTLVFLTDVCGVFDKNMEIIEKIKVKAVNALIKNGTIKNGMIPKIESCINSVKRGVEEVWIADGTSGIKKIKGTVITKN